MHKLYDHHYKQKGMVEMTRSSRQIQLALENAKASLAIEGMHLTQTENELLLKRVNEEITHSEFLARAVEVAKNVRK